MLKPALLAALALACAAPAAQARHLHSHHAHRAVARIASPRLHGSHREAFRDAAIGERSELLSHPRGCPPRQFCACGAAVRIFGAPIRSLWLAASWFRFPRTQPAPGMVAVRRHHVFVLEARLAPGIWRVYDANSGHHLTRRHARSIAGWTIVDPHGATL